MSQENLLGVVFEEVHARVRPAAALLEPGQILGLIYELVVVVASGRRATVARGRQVEIVRLIALPVAVYVLGVPHFGLA